MLGIPPALGRGINSRSLAAVLGIPPVGIDLGQPAPGARFGRGINIKLDAGIGQDYGANVPPGHYNAAGAAAGNSPLPAHQSPAHPGYSRYRRNIAVNPRRVQLIPRPVTGNSNTPIANNFHREMMRQTDDSLDISATAGTTITAAIASGQTALQSQPGQRPVHQPGIQKSQAKPPRRRPPHGAFAGGNRPVNSNHRPNDRPGARG